MSSVKIEAKTLVEELPDEATWDDLIYRIYVRQSIEKGLEDANHGRLVDLEQVRRTFGLDS